MVNRTIRSKCELGWSTILERIAPILSPSKRTLHAYRKQEPQGPGTNEFSGQCKEGPTDNRIHLTLSKKARIEFPN